MNRLLTLLWGPVWILARFWARNTYESYWIATEAIKEINELLFGPEEPYEESYSTGE